MNTLIAIGYLGGKRVYLNKTREEAIRLYEESEQEKLADNPYLTVKEISFTDEFWAYDVSEP